MASTEVDAASEEVMGLDIVELFMRVEEEFGIDIPDEEAGQANTVGDIYQIVVAKLALRDFGKLMPTTASLGISDSAKANAGRWTEDEIWERLVVVFVEQIGVEKEEIIPTARLVDDLGID